MYARRASVGSAADGAASLLAVLLVAAALYRLIVAGVVLVAILLVIAAVRRGAARRRAVREYRRWVAAEREANAAEADTLVLPPRPPDGGFAPWPGFETDGWPYGDWAGK